MQEHTHWTCFSRHSTRNREGHRGGSYHLTGARAESHRGADQDEEIVKAERFISQEPVIIARRRSGGPLEFRVREDFFFTKYHRQYVAKCHVSIFQKTSLLSSLLG